MGKFAAFQCIDFLFSWTVKYIVISVCELAIDCHHSCRRGVIDVAENAASAKGV